MRGRKAQMEEIREIIRCYRQTRSLRSMARTLNCVWHTVREYVRWAQTQGYLDGAVFIPRSTPGYFAIREGLLRK